jgi:hypothetical protein
MKATVRSAVRRFIGHSPDLFDAEAAAAPVPR